MMRILLTFAVLSFGVPALVFADSRCPSVPRDASFSTPYPVHCVDQHTTLVLAPGVGDIIHSNSYSGTPSFISMTKDERWERSIYTDKSAERLERLNKLSRSRHVLSDVSVEALIKKASAKTANSREELDSIVQARCLLFTSSSLCKSAVEDGAALQCEGRAEDLALTATDRLGKMRKIGVLVGIVMDMGIESASYAAFFAVLKYVAPEIVAPVSAALNARYYFGMARDAVADTAEIARLEKTNWFAAFARAQKIKDYQAYCYDGDEQFKQRMTEALNFLQTVREERKPD